MARAREAVEAYLAALNAHDADAVAALVTEDFANEHVAVRGQSLVGRAAYRQRLDGFLGSFPDLCYDAERVAVDGDQVVVAYRMTARWVPPDGGEARPFSLPGVFWFEVRDGLVARRVDYRDGVDFEQQVGLRS